MTMKLIWAARLTGLYETVVKLAKKPPGRSNDESHKSAAKAWILLQQKKHLRSYSHLRSFFDPRHSTLRSALSRTMARISLPLLLHTSHCYCRLFIGIPSPRSRLFSRTLHAEISNGHDSLCKCGLKPCCLSAAPVSNVASAETWVDTLDTAIVHFLTAEALVTSA